MTSPADNDWSEDDDVPTISDVRARLAAGMTDAEIRVDLGLSEALFDRLKQAAIVEEAQSFRHQSAENLYAGVRIRVLRIAGDLQDTATEARAAKQYQAAVTALKAEGTLIRGLIETGQELGVLPRAAKVTHTNVSGGLVLGALSNPELGEKLKEDRHERARLRRSYGSGLDLLDVEQQDIYQDEPEEPEKYEEPVRRRRKE